MTPFIVRLNRPDWKLSDAVTEKFNCQSVYGRYVKEGYAHYTYELFCVFPREGSRRTTRRWASWTRFKGSLTDSSAARTPKTRPNQSSVSGVRDGRVRPN